MTRKTKIGVVHFAPGEIEPICIAARAAPRMAVGVSAKTFANWRSQKKGPPFMVIDGLPYYPWKEFKEYFSTGRVETFNGGNL